MKIQDFLQICPSPRCISNSRNHICQLFSLYILFADEIYADSCLLCTSKISTIYLPKLYYKPACTCRTIKYCMWECGSNLLHLFMFEFFVGKHSPQRGSESYAVNLGVLVQKAAH